jgi:hypothetical protein
MPLREREALKKYDVMVSTRGRRSMHPAPEDGGFSVVDSFCFSLPWAGIFARIQRIGEKFEYSNDKI